MKQTKTKSVDARRLAETEMDDDADVKSFIFFLLSLSFLSIFARVCTRARTKRPPVGRPFMFSRARLRSRCVSLSLSLSLFLSAECTRETSYTHENSLGFFHEP